MSDWPNTALPPLPMVTPFSEESLGGLVRYFAGAAVASTTLGNQIAQFFPWLVESPITIVKGWLVNGASANGTIDVGVYDHEFNLIVSIGSGQSQGSANTLQEFDITDTTLMPGRYWMAIVCAGTGTVFARSAADELILAGHPLLEQTSQSTLPSTASPARNTQTTPIIPLFGFSTEATI